MAALPSNLSPLHSPPEAVSPRQHVHYGVDYGSSPGYGSQSAHTGNDRLTRSDSVLTSGEPSPLPGRRRSTRMSTFRPVQDFEVFSGRPGWQPGSEPGVDPAKPDGGHASRPAISAPCEIDIVDFSQEDMTIHRLDNNTLPPHLKIPQPGWVKCRWINVKGLSWDVIQVLGQYKGLHRLAIEDIMDTKNRTKADWFPNHAFIVLMLHKLVHIGDPHAKNNEKPDETDDEGRSGGHSRLRGFAARLRQGFARRFPSLSGSLGYQEQEAAGLEVGNGDKTAEAQPAECSDDADTRGSAQFRTIQNYHASTNEARTSFMTRNSTLAERRLAVAAEQVCIFITNDNTVISFFEVSAEDVEGPILRRLESPDTILRQSCDASMIGQAIIDAIIDLAIPVTACYSDVVEDLELDVLTRPHIGHTRKLYIAITEINKMLSLVNPIINLINTLRDHKTDMGQEAATRALQNPQAGVIITPMTYTYLGDVLDHCVLIADSLNQIRSSADGMIDLIFNTISASQNDFMKQLTVASVIFLPLTFLTGYFGQNFQPFDDLERGISFFWKIAAPVVVATIFVFMRPAILDFVGTLMQRRHIGRLRKISDRRRGRKQT